MVDEAVHLLSVEDLPPGFEYPREFVRIVQLGLTNLEPWRIIEGERLLNRLLGLRGRYPNRTLVPFARRQDNDDVACWDIDEGNVAVIHDFASEGWEQRVEFPDFNSWLRQAVEDLIAFE